MGLLAAGLGMAAGGVLGGLFGGKSSQPKTMSSLTPEQRAIVSAMTGQLLGEQNSSGDWSGGLLNTKLKSYGGKLAPTNMSYYQDALSGLPAYDLSEATTTRRFNESVVNPAMRAYDQYIAPRIKESYANVGGISSRTGYALSNQLGSMQSDFASQLSNMLYSNEQLNVSMAENAANRKLQAAQIATQMQQAQLSNKYSEWLRTQPQNNPMWNVALGLTGQSQMAAYNPGPSTLQSVMSGAFGGFMGSGGMSALSNYLNPQQPTYTAEHYT